MPQLLCHGKATWRPRQHPNRGARQDSKPSDAELAAAGARANSKIMLSSANGARASSFGSIGTTDIQAA